MKRTPLTFGLVAGLLTVLSSSGPALAQSGTTLEVWYHQYGEAGTLEAVKRYAEEYSKASGVKVNITWIPGDYNSKLSAALLSGKGPDVFENWYVYDLVKAGQVAPLDELLTPAVRADMDKQAIAATTVNGKTYGIKMVTDAMFLYYRKSLLTKAGVKPPTTFDELVAAAQKLNTGGVKGLFVGNDGGVGVLQTVLPWSAGADFIKGTQVSYNTPRVVKAYNAMRTLNKSGALLVGAPTDWGDPSAFTQGLTAMQWCGLWAMPAIKTALGDDFGVVPWPKLDAQGKPVVNLGGWSAFVNAKSSNLAAAKAYVNSLWIENRKVQADFNTAYGFHIPPRKSAVAAAVNLKSGPAAEAARITAKYGKQLPPIWSGNFNTILGDAAAAVIRTDTPVADLVRDASVKSQAELNRALK